MGEINVECTTSRRGRRAGEHDPDESPKRAAQEAPRPKPKYHASCTLKVNNADAIRDVRAEQRQVINDLADG
jgi:hypothetical protein